MSDHRNTDTAWLEYTHRLGDHLADLRDDIRNHHRAMPLGRDYQHETALRGRNNTQDLTITLHHKEIRIHAGSTEIPRQHRRGNNNPYQAAHELTHIVRQHWGIQHPNQLTINPWEHPSELHVAYLCPINFTLSDHTPRDYALIFEDDAITIEDDILIEHDSDIDDAGQESTQTTPDPTPPTPETPRL